MTRRNKYRDIIFDANRMPFLLHYREGENAVELPYRAMIPARRTGGSPPAPVPAAQPHTARLKVDDDLANATWEDAEWQ